MKLKIEIEASEFSDLLIELREVLQLVTAGVTYSGVDSASGFSSHEFSLDRFPQARAGKGVEKKQPARAGRKGKRNG